MEVDDRAGVSAYQGGTMKPTGSAVVCVQCAMASQPEQIPGCRMGVDEGFCNNEDAAALALRAAASA